MKNIYLLIAIFLLMGCSDQKNTEKLSDREISLREKYAPDSRTDRLVLNSAPNYLGGYTTQAGAAAEIASFAAQKGWVSAIRVLPDTAVGAKNVGIIKVSVANLRSKPGHSQELATQALLGTPVQLLDLVNGWYFVRTPDRYLAWLEPGAMMVMTKPEAANWFDKDLRVYVGQGGELLSSPGAGRVISSLVPGGIVAYSPDEPNVEYALVSLPDGAKGWVATNDLMSAAEWLNSQELETNALISVAERLAGRPYLWGGTSPNGMDCSGFTKMSYYFNGFVIPRDASQQVHAGEEVPLTDDYANLLPGDQLFFGSYREDGSEKITHTGFYLGKGRFLHAGADNGRIRENSLLPEDEDYAEHRLKSLLRARRLRPGTEGVVPVGAAFRSMIQ